MPSAPNNPSLEVCGLSVNYGKYQALKNITLSIKPGELVGVIGPNGAGKTSFIKALCGRVPSKGQISLTGQTLTYGQDRRQKIGLVPQEIGLYPTLTARENLDVIARLLGVKSDRRGAGIEKALDVVGLGERGNSLVQDLSGGMKRRINVAAAIMHDPDLVILDEPTAGVDIPARDILHQLARGIAEKGKAVILVTHELEQAEVFCDKVLLLCQGKQLYYDTPSAILSNEFGSIRHVVLDFSQPPSRDSQKILEQYRFIRSNTPNLWTATTKNIEDSYIADLMAALIERQEAVKEISVKRPGLTELMHRLEKTKRPSP